MEVYFIMVNSKCVSVIWGSIPAFVYEICAEMHALAKMAELAINRQYCQTVKKIQMRWQRGPLEGGDFGENGVYGGNGGNGD